MSIEISGLDNASFFIDRYHIMTTFLDEEKMYFELNIWIYPRLTKFIINLNPLEVEPPISDEKISNLSPDNFKNHVISMARHPSPRYGHVILVSGYSFLKLSIDHNMDM